MENLTISKINIDKHFIGCVASGDLYSEPCELFKEDISSLYNDFPDVSSATLRKLEGVW